MKRNWKNMLIILTIMCGYLAVIGTNHNVWAQSKSKTKINGEVYVWIGAVIDIPYFIDHRLGLEAAGKELGVETRFLGPKEYDIPAMIKLTKEVIAQKPAGIEMIGFVEELAPLITKAVDAGIAVVTLDADVKTSKRLTFIGTNNYRAGRKIASLLAHAINDKGKVAIVTNVGQTNLEERVKGFKDELKENFPKIKLVQVIDAEANSDRASAGTKGVMLIHRDLAGIGCMEATGGKGAARMVEEKGKAGKVAIVSMDRDDETLKYIKKGTITASVAQKTALMSYLGVKLLHQHYHKRLSITSNDERGNINIFPAEIDTGLIVITKDNVKYFYK